MKTIIKRISILAVLLAFLVLPYFVFAQSPLNALQNVGNSAGYQQANNTSVASIAGAIVAAILSLLGVIFIILIIYAGILWMTAQGDEPKLEKAKKIITNAIIGLIITIGVFGIYQLVNLFIYQNLK
jgi:Type IV secretion system pilin